MAGDIAKEKKSYKAVMWTLFGATCMALALGVFSFLDFGPPGPTWEDVVIGLGLAGFKASLVALIFMHLNHEKGLIYKMLVFTVIFFIGLMALTLFSDFDPILEQFGTLETTNGKLTEEVK